MIDYQTIRPGDILVSTPNSDKGIIFDRSVILILTHDKNGSSGIMVNKLLNVLEGKDIVSSLQINKNKILAKTNEVSATAKLPIFFGGPVEQEKGIIIHSDDYLTTSSLEICKGAVISMNSNVVKDISLDVGPLHKMLILGYTGWSAGQLNDEIKRDDWILVTNKYHNNRFSPIFKLLFLEDPAYRWKFALEIAKIRTHNYIGGGANA